ncbi:energy-coupling factor ABC transporter ATP-binding protein [Paenibacillus taihuensis]|uniref:energy-coupling factor ABC transporter ATP-binding protein n=1 Tax=Paenibacillus taihuensis TaxID=1156355 RepID=UPI0015F27541|nr:ABC transporter ATP-binding protein [Paenibacillus taihuensis]
MTVQDAVGGLILSDVNMERFLESGEVSPRLDHIDFSLAPGEWVHIVGTNGSGKSTLARLLAGLTIDGVQGTWNRGFAGNRPMPYVMQQPDSQLFAETPRQEVRFALEWQGVSADEILHRTEAILTRTGLLSIGDVPWERLSGGQRQLAAVAAASAASAPLIVFDEATSMLDEQSCTEVLRLARELHRQGTAVVWVTQRLQEIEGSGRVVAMLDGRIVFDGLGSDFLYGSEAEAEADADADADAVAGAVALRTPHTLTPCQACGLRLPYLPALALELGRQGKLKRPYPETAAEWEQVLSQL